MIKANYYWDSCVFIAHLNDERGQHGSTIDDIGQFLTEAAAGKCTIFCSTITIAEIPESSLTRGRFAQFLQDFQASVVPIDPGPAIMRMAAHLRSQPYEKQGSRRTLGTPDAIHLATAVALSKLFSVEIDAFHTFDSGKRRGPDGKNVPLIGFQEWCGPVTSDEVVAKAISLARQRPQHLSPTLSL